MEEEFDNFYLDSKEPQRSTFLALRDLILEHDSHIWESRKYGMPCFLYAKRILCYLWSDRKTEEPYILFADGNLMDNPHLEKGNRARMKILRIDPWSDLPVEIIKEILDMAIDLVETRK